MKNLFLPATGTFEFLQDGLNLFSCIEEDQGIEITENKRLEP
jgi:hypothetical protein